MTQHQARPISTPTSTLGSTRKLRGTTFSPENVRECTCLVLLIVLDHSGSYSVMLILIGVASDEASLYGGPVLLLPLSYYGSW